MNLKKAWHSFRLLLCKDGYARAEYIRKKDLFGYMGENCYFHPYWMPGDPKHIFIHDNVKISAQVTFINHDIAASMLNVKTGTKNFKYFIEPIEIFDNVVIGSNTTILPGRKIGPNCIVGAGSVVCRDIPADSVAAGNPVRVIKPFAAFEQARREYGETDRSDSRA